MIQMETATTIREKGPQNKKDYDTTKNNLHNQIIDFEKQVNELQQLIHKLHLEKVWKKSVNRILLW